VFFFLLPKSVSQITKRELEQLTVNAASNRTWLAANASAHAAPPSQAPPQQQQLMGVAHMPLHAVPMGVPFMPPPQPPQAPGMVAPAPTSMLSTATAAATPSVLQQQQFAPVGQDPSLAAAQQAFLLQMQQQGGLGSMMQQ
jgi:hypothetical protein